VSFADLHDWERGRRLEELEVAIGCIETTLLQPSVSPSKPKRPSGRHDPAERRRGTRGQRRKGCFIYIPAEALEKAGYDPQGEPPYYRIWAAPRGRVVVQLYREK
jgi:hypothetical protein